MCSHIQCQWQPHQPVCYWCLKPEYIETTLGQLACRGILGWLHTVKGIPMKKLSFQTALPSQKRQGVAVAFEYIQWLVEERNISATTEGLVIRSLMQASVPTLQPSVSIEGLSWQRAMKASVLARIRASSASVPYILVVIRMYWCPICGCVLR